MVDTCVSYRNQNGQKDIFKMFVPFVLPETTQVKL